MFKRETTLFDMLPISMIHTRLTHKKLKELDRQQKILDNELDFKKRREAQELAERQQEESRIKREEQLKEKDPVAYKDLQLRRAYIEHKNTMNQLNVYNPRWY